LKKRLYRAVVDLSSDDESINPVNPYLTTVGGSAQIREIRLGDCPLDPIPSTSKGFTNHGEKIEVKKMVGAKTNVSSFFILNYWL
jgi:hypothetical protein